MSKFLNFQSQLLNPYLHLSLGQGQPINLEDLPNQLIYAIIFTNLIISHGSPFN